MFRKFREFVMTDGAAVPKILTETQLVLLCFATALLCGVVIAIAYRIKNKNYSRNLMVALSLLPVVVMSLVLVVNTQDALGTGVAIAGAFALIRFRSVPGNSRDVMCVFFAMAVGVAAGATYILFAIILTAVVSAIFIGYKFIPLERICAPKNERELRITVPEDLDYQKELGEVFALFAEKVRTTEVKTDKMGSLFVLTYRLNLKTPNTDKQFIDALRVKNGNLPIVCRIYDKLDEKTI